MSDPISLLKKSIATEREQLINHEIYNLIQTPEDLTVFMEHHVFAVWDFMSLLKKLQIDLTCTTIPWLPKGNAAVRYLINEIVTGEESDIDECGQRTSHFELYLKAMQQGGANLQPISSFVDAVQQRGNLSAIFDELSLSSAIKEFVSTTFEAIETNETSIVAAVFTFGREDLIPDMFRAIVNDIDTKFPNKISTFKYYLERHIEVDEGHHTPLAIQMVTELCQNNELKWQQAEMYVKKALQARINLWNAVVQSIQAKNKILLTAL